MEGRAVSWVAALFIALLPLASGKRPWYDGTDALPPPTNGVVPRTVAGVQPPPSVAPSPVHPPLPFSPPPALLLPPPPVPPHVLPPHPPTFSPPPAGRLSPPIYAPHPPPAYAPHPPPAYVPASSLSPPNFPVPSGPPLPPPAPAVLLDLVISGYNATYIENSFQVKADLVLFMLNVTSPFADSLKIVSITDGSHPAQPSANVTAHSMPGSSAVDSCASQEGPYATIQYYIASKSSSMLNYQLYIKFVMEFNSTAELLYDYFLPEACLSKLTDWDYSSAPPSAPPASPPAPVQPLPPSGAGIMLNLVISGFTAEEILSSHQENLNTFVANVTGDLCEVVDILEVLSAPNQPQGSPSPAPIAKKSLVASSLKIPLDEICTIDEGSLLTVRVYLTGPRLSQLYLALSDNFKGDGFNTTAEVLHDYFVPGACLSEDLTSWGPVFDNEEWNPLPESQPDPPLPSPTTPGINLDLTLSGYSASQISGSQQLQKGLEDFIYNITSPSVETVRISFVANSNAESPRTGYTKSWAAPAPSTAPADICAARNGPFTTVRLLLTTQLPMVVNLALEIKFNGIFSDATVALLYEVFMPGACAIKELTSWSSTGAWPQ